MFFFSSRRRHTRSKRDWSSDVCSSDLPVATRGRADRAGRRRRGASYCLLQSEQGVLGVEPTEVATQAAVGAKHPVAGHHDREGVGGAGGADRTDRSWVSDQGGDLLVGQGVPVADAWQIPLHTLPEPRRQGVVQGYVELVAAAREVFFQLAGHRVE